MDLIIVRGCSGSGKTTVASMLNDIVISADDYFMVHGEYRFNAMQLPDAHKQCYDRVACSMNNKVERIVVANTFTTEKELQPYIDLANANNYKVFSIVVENRHGCSNVHSVPDEKVKKQEQKLRQSLKLS